MKTLYLIVGISLMSISISCTNSVKISDRQVLVNGSPYIIKGICYHPVPKGSDKISFDNLSTDLSLMQEAGINTIRVYSPINDLAVLDEINAAGIKIIMGFGYNQDGYFDILSGSFIDYVNSFKDHDAILFWELGNEYNFHPEWFEGDIQKWYTALNNAADLIHKNDPEHPVSTAHGEMPKPEVLAVCPNIDIWGMNVYRWDNPESLFTGWKEISPKAMYLSETGADSYMTISQHGYEQGENEKAQADATDKILEAVFNNQQICAGLTLFSFADELWKAGDNNSYNQGGWAPNSGGVPYDGAANEEYWGITDIEGNKKKVFDVVKEKYLSLSVSKQ
ncbi:MAG: hypothetical protein K9H49_14670 [Bacteroidales bacterium]|nr:hypothetical protein [Bacteroidales bacterium]MCF8390544.1 hypothetical protein [Bacteroidales bacterium]